MILITKVILILIVMALLWSFIKSLFVTGDSSSVEHVHHEPRKPVHRFTNEEILTPGIDVRSIEHRQKLLDARRSKTPTNLSSPQFEQKPPTVKQQKEKTLKGDIASLNRKVNEQRMWKQVEEMLEKKRKK